MRVLLIGEEPEAVDFSSPALPPGMTAAKIREGIALALELMAARGWQAELCLVMPDETAGDEVARRLAAADYDCVVIGAGIRLPPPSLGLFERVINAVHSGAPAAAIAFNTTPADSAEAAGRWIGR
jgi:hypothetical protein